jgi:hypothetical protein
VRNLSPLLASRRLGAAVGCLLIGVTWGCDPQVSPEANVAAPGDPAPLSTEVAAAAIRNGQRLPRVVPLTDGQQLAVGWLHDPLAPEAAFCTGTLIEPRVVVTARHCTAGVDSTGIGFGVGMMPSAPEHTWAVESIAEHPDEDVALLVLERAATTDVPALQPLPINRRPLTAQDTGGEVEAAGYGDTLDPTRTGRYFAVLLFAGVDESYVLVDGRQREGLCFGDSGGPVFDVDPSGAPIILGVEHGGEESCVGRDQLTRLDRVQGWIDGMIAALPEGEPCGAESYLGHCEGDVAVWCHDNGLLARLDCAAEGRVCAYVDEETGYYCKSADACGGAATGCNGNVRIFCREGLLYQEDCGLSNGTCSVDAGGPICLGPDGQPVGSLTPPPDDLVSDEAAPDGPPPDAPPAIPPADVVDAGGPPAEASPRKGLAYEGGCRQAPGEGPGLGSLALAALLLRPRRRRR